MRTDLDEVIVVQRSHEKRLAEIATDKARVVTGAWVANGLTCVFVAVIMWLAQRAVAAEGMLLKQDLIREVKASMGPVRK